jgi:hypothetical protein
MKVSTKVEDAQECVEENYLSLAYPWNHMLKYISSPVAQISILCILSICTVFDEIQNKSQVGSSQVYLGAKF